MSSDTRKTITRAGGQGPYLAWSTGGQPERRQCVGILAVSPIVLHRVTLTRWFRHSGWNLWIAETLSAALALMRGRRVAVAICEADLRPGTWKDLLQKVGVMRAPPLLIVTAPAADEYLWAEVLNLGGYDVLQQPFDRREVMRVVSLGWAHWRDAYRREPERIRVAGAR